MALSGTALYFDLIARDQASAAFRRTGNEALTAAGKVDVLGGKMTRVGRSMTRSITLPVAAVGAVAVKMASDFDSSMAKIQGLVGISRKQIDAWSGDILQMAKTLPQSPKELSDALYYITSDGLRGAVALDTLKKSAMASAAGLGDTATVAETVTSAINAYGHKALDAGKATDVMVAAVRAGKLDAAALAPVLGRVIPIASEMGVSFDQVTAAIASMSRTGQSAQNAATSVQAILSGLLKPSAAGAKALNSVGLSFAGLRKEVSKQGLYKTLMDVKTAFHGNDAELAKVVPNVRALRGFLALTGKQAGTTGKIFNQTAHSSGNMDKAFKVASQTANFKFKSALSSLQVAMIDLGNKLLPAVTVAVGKLVGALDWFTSQPKLFQQITLGAVAFLAALGPVLTIGGNVLRLGVAIYRVAKFMKIATAAQWLLNVAMDANPVGLIIVAVAALGVALVVAYKKSATFRKIVNGAFHAVGAAASSVFGWIKDHWKLLASILGGPFVAAVIIIASNWGKVKAGASAVFGFIKGLWGKFLAVLTAPFKLYVAVMTKLPGRIVAAVGNLGHLLWNAGQQIIQGLISGIDSMIGSLTSKLHSITKLIPIHKGPIEKDRVLLRGAGVAIMEGLIKGIESQQVPLTTILDKVTNAVKAANDKLKSAIQARNSFAGGFQSFASSAFGADYGTDANGNAVAPTVASILAYQQRQANQAHMVKRDVHKLVKMGLSPALIKQLQAAGASGIAEIQALANATPSQIRQFNALNKQTSSDLHSAGMSAANAIYGEQIKADRKHAHEEHHLLREIRDAIKHMNEKELVAHIHGGDLIIAVRHAQRKKGQKPTV